jgi:hypothetical protein
MIRQMYLLVLCNSIWLTATGLLLAQPGDSPTQDLEVTPFAFGVHRYEPGNWSTVGVRAFNNHESDEEAMLSVFIDPHSRSQYMRRMWVPARAVRVTWLPLHVPTYIPRNQPYLDLNALKLQGMGRGESLQPQSYDTMISNYVLALDSSLSKTAILFAKSSADAHRIDRTMYELVTKMKERIDGSRITLTFGGDFFPPTPFAYQALDQLVICDDRIVDDSVGLHAIRHWLQQGGRAWLPLDRVNLSTLTALLGDAMGCEIIDRTELNHYMISDLSRYPDSAADEVWQSERAVEFIRVVTDSSDVQCEVDGWPAAFWCGVGNGEVLITTLPPEGFLIENTRHGSLAVSSALHSISTRFFQTRNAEPVDMEASKPLLIQQIGYRIPSRGRAAVILFLNCGLVCAAGWWLARRKKLEHLAWIAPAAALGATAAFGWMGRAQNRQVPPSAASFQFVQVTPENNSADVLALTAVYSPASLPLPLNFRAGELVVPDVSDLTNVVKRITFDDSGQATWEGISMKPGTVRFVRHYSPITWEKPIRAVAQFGPSGLVGKILGTEQWAISDPVIACPPSPNLAVSLDPDGSFHGRPADVLGVGQYVSGTILDDAQRRRKAIFQQMHRLSRETGYPHSPTLFAWSETLPAPLSLGPGFAQVGTALVAIPLTIDRTPPGSRFVVPATFVQPRLIHDRRGLSPAYNSRTGEWVDELMGPMATPLRFIVPSQVLPCRIDRAKVTVNLTAPSRNLRLYGYHEGEPVLLHEQANPNGTYTIPIENTEALDLDEHGGFVISVEIGEQRGVEDEGKIEAYMQSAWQIRYVRVEVEGQTLD